MLNQNGKQAVEEIIRILRETGEGLETPHQQILIKQAERLETMLPAMIRPMPPQKELLAKRFPEAEHKTRKGARGKQLTYVETVNYIDRLNEIFGLHWSWELTEQGADEVGVWSRGRLTIEIDGKTVVKEAYGGNDKNGEIGDALKGASSDALKKACSLLGMGLYMYRDKK